MDAELEALLGALDYDLARRRWTDDLAALLASLEAPGSWVMPPDLQRAIDAGLLLTEPPAAPQDDLTKRVQPALEAARERRAARAPKYVQPRSSEAPDGNRETSTGGVGTVPTSPSPIPPVVKQLAALGEISAEELLEAVSRDPSPEEIILSERDEERRPPPKRPEPIVLDQRSGGRIVEF